MEQIEFNAFGRIKEVYPYRTARVVKWGIKIHMSKEDMMSLRDEMEDAGFEMDNHIVIVFDMMGTETNMWLHDGNLYVGGQVEKMSY